MKIKAQASADMQHLADTLEKHRVAMMTVNEDGGLCSRPMTPLEMDTNGAIWIMSSHATMDSVLAGEGQPVNLAFTDHSDSDYISVVGHARLVDDVGRKKELWTAMGRPWFDGPEDPKLVLICVTPKSADIWDGPDSSFGRVLALAASVVAGKEVGLGHKETVTAPGSR